MDETDEKILEILQEDGRAAYTEIAGELGVSEGTVRNRVERMQEEGTIERFTVEVRREQGIEAFVMVQVGTDVDIAATVEEFPEDVEVFELAGDQDLLVKLSGSSSEDINDTVDEIRIIEGVESTRTYMVLGKPK